MHIGNDVVDLRDPEVDPGAVHARFDQRVFTPEERERVRAAPLSRRIRWSLWAAKESAFKAARKLDPDVPFHPRRFVVKPLDGGRAEVIHRTVGRFKVWLEEAQDWIHAAATTFEEEVAPPRWAVSLLDGGARGQGDPSRMVRELARRTLAPLLALDPTELRVVAVNGIPRLCQGREALPLDLSLSHHGRVLACAWRPTGPLG